MVLHPVTSKSEKKISEVTAHVRLAGKSFLSSLMPDCLQTWLDSRRQASSHILGKARLYLSMTRKQKVGHMSTLTGHCTSQKLGPSIFWRVFSKARKLEVGHPSTLTGHQSSQNICSTHPMQVAIDCVPAWQDSREGAFKSPPQVTQPPTEALPAFSGKRLHIDTHRSLNLPLEGRRPHIDTHRSLNLPQRPCRPSVCYMAGGQEASNWHSPVTQPHGYTIA